MNEREQQGQPERDIQQHGEDGELGDPKQEPRYAGRQSLIGEPLDCTGLLPNVSPPCAAKSSAAAFCVRGTGCRFHRSYLVWRVYRVSCADQPDRLAAIKLAQSSGGFPRSSIFSNTA